MKQNKSSITVKVIIGYLLLAALAALALWFIYVQVISYTDLAQNRISGNDKLYLVSEAATDLYEAESLSRQIIQTGDTSNMASFVAKTDSIRATLEVLKNNYADPVLIQEIDSIGLLLTRKTRNLRELLALRNRNNNQSYYSRAISQLQLVDENFEDPKYEERFQELEPHQRRVLIKLLEYSRRENPKQVTVQTIDSLVNSVKTVLTELELTDRRYRENLRNKENELLANELELNNQLRNLLSVIEAEEREASLAQVSASQKIINKSSQIIAVVGGISFLVLLVFLFLIVRDVSRSKRYRIELEDAKQYAESLLKSREQFMATITHDLRSPLNTVLGYINLLEKSKLGNSQSSYLNQLKNSSGYILQLVNDLLDFSKLQSGKIKIETLDFNPKHLIEETVENAIPVEKSKDVSVVIDISEDLDELVHADAFRIRQILTNLITNAWKFTEKGQVSITGKLESEKDGKNLMVAVEDTGIGISEERQAAIFEEFSQENNSIERRFGGSGLGLAISKKLTALLHGSIQLESKQGKGSSFVLRVPVKPAKAQAPAPQQISFRRDINQVKLPVLIVDDEPAQQVLLQELLNSVGLKWKVCNNGEEAIRKLEKDKFALVLTDIQMPEMDGFELLSRMQEDTCLKAIPVIALSGKTDIEPVEYHAKGFSRSLLKPYTPQELLQLLEETLNIDLPKNPASKSETQGKTFSLSEIAAFTGGDEAALKAVLKAFVESTQQNLEKLREAEAQHDEEKISAVSHKMLPMFRQIKAKDITRELELLEAKDKKPKKEIVDKLIVKIKRLMRAVKQEIKD